ncbi:MAG: DUF2281 domain-containing protein [Bacteroidetes bacterium]|nr:DUF2281 domain-containing protein [Bacteroidota bacterium]
MIRTVLTPDKQNVSIHLPKNYVGKKIEVIAFAIEETVQQSEKERILTHFASEKTLSKDWLTPEEDQAWKDL